MKKKITDVLFWVFATICIWIGVTTSIDGFMHPRKTETELFLDIPKSFILNFK